MLPFGGLEDAAASLGRPLTLAEILWFRYTANTPDHLIYTFVFFLSFCVLFLCPLPLAAVEVISPKFIYRFKLQPNVRTPFSRLLHCCKHVMTVFLVSIVPMGLVSFPFFKLLGIRASLPLPSAWEVTAQLLVYFVVEDYCIYWIHRWMHRPWPYRKIHHVHHEFAAPVGISAVYAHWGDVLFQGLSAIVGPAIVPCHVVTLYMWVVLLQLQTIETHCGYDFPWCPTKFIPFYGGAEYHDYHHFVGKSQSNFAPVFTYCDYLYGTDKGYRYRKACLARPPRDSADTRRNSRTAVENGEIVQKPDQNLKSR
ncbi:unnamed protein product [Victoria cruziana]